MSGMTFCIFIFGYEIFSLFKIMKDYFDILGLKRCCTEQEIDAA